MKKTKPLITIKELRGFAPMKQAYPLIRTQNPALGKAEFERRLKVMLKLGYRCIAAFEGAKMVGVCGFWQGTKFWCGDYIEPDNLVVDPTVRRLGIGKLLFDWIEKLGRKAGAHMMMFDTYVSAYDTHRFHFAQGYHILGYHMVKRFKE